MEKLLLTVEEAAQALGIGRTRAFALIRGGQMHSVKIGTSRRVPLDALHEFIRAATCDAAV